MIFRHLFYWEGKFMQQRMDTKKMVTLALLSALAFLAVLVVRIPIIPSAPFLDYEPKDIILVIGGFLFGPLSALLMSVTVAFVEMITISRTGWIGFVMNVLSSAAFVCVAAAIYQKGRNLKGAVVGLVTGTVSMVLVMLLWNYFLTPLYMAVGREDVAKMLVPIFLPFNLLKGGLNAAIAMLAYKPVVTALRQARLMPAPESASASKGKVNIGVILLSCFVIASCVLFILVLQGRI